MGHQGRQHSLEQAVPIPRMGTKINNGVKNQFTVPKSDWLKLDLENIMYASYKEIYKIQVFIKPLSCAIFL